MNSSESSLLEELFHRAVDLPRDERERFLRENCGDDLQLREKLTRLLRSDAAASGSFMQPASDGGDGSGGEVGASPTQIGRYTIVRKIGEGGMGVVYEARQEHPSRIVALKVIRPGMTSPALLKRFTHEAHILGQLHHPGIACIYEAGVAEIHTPGIAQARESGAQRLETSVAVQFFAMEFVHGRPLTDYAAEHKLTTRDRLDLFAKICDAVQHAHQKGVIHRDLKPANILVVDDATNPPAAETRATSIASASEHQTAVRQSQSAIPKVLDFGVARLTDSDVHTVTLQTDVGQLIGTVPYMSPEQVLGDSRLVDVRSDVYALGVILYELLAGRLPLDLKNRSIPEASRMIREEEPSMLSSIDTQFRGDIENIVGKTLEKDRERRYGSAAELADDIRRYLRVEPILARPASAVYRIRKFAWRNKVLVGASAVVLVVLVAGITGTSIGFVRASREARIARSESAIARAVTEFLNKDLLAAVDPDELGKDVSMRKVLDEAAKRIKGRFPEQPEVEAAIRVTLGETYLRLGVLDAADTQLTLAHETRIRVLGPDHADTRSAARLLVQLWNRQGRYADAERAARTLLEQDRRASGSDHDTCMTDMHALAQSLVNQGRLTEAEQVHREVLEVRRRVQGEENERTLLTYGELGALLMRMRRFEEAEPILERNLAAQRRHLGNEHSHTLFTLNSLAVLKRETGRLEEAESLFSELLEAMKRVFGPEHPNTLFACGDLCTVYERLKRFPEAERLAKATLDTLSRVLGPEHGETLFTMEKLAQVYTAQNRWSDAEPVYATLVDRAERTGNAYLGDFLRGQGRVLAKLARFEEAETSLLKAAQLPRATPESPIAPKIIHALVALYEAWGKPEEATVWRSKLPSPAAAKSASN